MQSLQIIEQREVLGKEFKIYGDFENPLFLAKDVAEWIGHSNLSKMIADAELEDAEKIILEVPTNLKLEGLQSNTKYTFLTEEGLYEVLMQSRKPIAKQFKKQVKVILKDIRKHGMYAKDELLDNPDLLLDVITKYKEEKERNKELEDKITEQKPKVLFADAVASSKTSILIGELAKILKQNGFNTGQNRLFQTLRNKGFLMKEGASKNMPTQRAMEMGLFEIKETTITNPDGSIRVTKTAKVTGKGQQYFISMFLRK